MISSDAHNLFWQFKKYQYAANNILKNVSKESCFNKVAHTYTNIQ